MRAHYKLSMDYKDLQAGQNKNNFWFKAKNDLIEVLMQKICKNLPRRPLRQTRFDARRVEARVKAGKKRLKILNVGAGTGGDLKTLNKFGDIYVVDIDQNALAIIDNKLCVEKKLADACNLPYNNNFFDAVVSFDVFEHIKNDKKAAAEIHRVLKNNGVLVFTVPAFQFLFSSHDKALCHQRRYNAKSIKTLLSQFSNLKIFFWNSLLFFPIATVRLFNKKSAPKVDKANLHPLTNYLFYKLLSVDNFLIKKGISMPIGLSIVGYCYKD